MPCLLAHGLNCMELATRAVTDLVLAAFLVLPMFQGCASVADRPNTVPEKPSAGRADASSKTPLEVPDVSAFVAAGEDVEYRLSVKFHDGVRARATSDGRVVSLAGADLADLEKLRARFSLTFVPEINLDPETIERLRCEAAKRSGRAQPDLAGILEVEFPNMTAERLLAVGEALQELDVVDYAEIKVENVPPPDREGSSPPPPPRERQ